MVSITILRLLNINTSSGMLGYCMQNRNKYIRYAILFQYGMGKNIAFSKLMYFWQLWQISTAL